MILFLVGYAGSGKSSLAKRLSRELGVTQLDTDKLVEQHEGASIADIFFYQGEEYFRRAERDVIEELVLSGYDGIVATGGGLPTWGDNMSRLNEVGYTVYLKRSPEQILSRLRGEQIDVDTLAAEVKRATELIAQCKAQLTDVEQAVKAELEA